MRPKTLVSAVLFTVAAGCATMPGPVNTSYLADKTPEEAKSVEKIEIAVVAKKGERDAAQKGLKTAELRLRAEESRRNQAKALLALKEAEMSVLVAELDYEKAKIARKYQDKRPDQFKESDSFWRRIVSPSSLVRVDSYEKHLDEQRRVLVDRKKDMDEATRLRSEAESLVPGGEK